MIDVDGKEFDPGATGGPGTGRRPDVGRTSAGRRSEVGRTSAGPRSDVGRRRWPRDRTPVPQGRTGHRSRGPPRRTPRSRGSRRRVTGGLGVGGASPLVLESEARHHWFWGWGRVTGGLGGEAGHRTRWSRGRGRVIERAGVVGGCVRVARSLGRPGRFGAGRGAWVGRSAGGRAGRGAWVRRFARGGDGGGNVPGRSYGWRFRRPVPVGVGRRTGCGTARRSGRPRRGARCGCRARRCVRPRRRGSGRRRGRWTGGAR